jgi:multiple sugar transport system substrate-binding protein
MSTKSPVTLTRRHLLGTALGGAAVLAAGRSFAAGKTLNVLSHKVHQTVIGSGDGDLLKDWRSANDVDIAWNTFDSNPLQDRLFREASLGSTEFNVGYIIDNRPTSQIATLFEPLDEYLKKEPIEAFDDIAPGLVQGMTVDGKLIGIPVRHATQGLFYNEALLEEQGIGAPPKTLEELVEQAQKLTFTSKSGTRVSGMVLASDLAVFPVMFARAFGGDFLTKTFELIPDRTAMEKGLTVLKTMFVLPFARYAQLNNPEQSKFPGKIKVIEFPVSAALGGKVPMASVVEAWGMVIPKNSRDKDLSWKFIREVSSKRVTLGMANNGNGPVRVSTYKDASFAGKNPVAAVEAAALANARGAFPPFPEAARAQSIFLEEVQLAVLGRKPVGEAIDSISSRVKPLLPV